MSLKKKINLIDIEEQMVIKIDKDKSKKIDILEKSRERRYDYARKERHKR